MLPHRQRKLLELLRELGGQVSNTDFQKLLFLYCQRFDDSSEAPYQFVPYKFGAFSFTSYADKRRLVERGVLREEESRWVLAEPPSEEERPAKDERAAIRKFRSELGSLRGDALVAHTYRNYPWTAVNSVIAGKVLRSDSAALESIDRLRQTRQLPGISTIGYQGRSLETYLNQLLRDGVTVLCDVRRNPLSRKYGFSKKTLGNGCEGVGIRYEHLRELGIDSSERRSLNTQADYDALFARYRSESLPQQQESLGAIHDWVESDERVSLTCYEELPIQCHRHCVADELVRQFGDRFRPSHL